MVAEKRRQKRLNREHKHKLDQQRKDAAHRRKLELTATGKPTTRLARFWLALREVPGRVQEFGVQIGYGMALIGSGVGQLGWWGAMFPLIAAAAFALTFEAIMIGSSRRALRLRKAGEHAVTLRLIAFGSAGFGAWLNWKHWGDPNTVAKFLGYEIHGSASLGLSFAAFTAAGFLVHELSKNADVRRELIAKGMIKPIGWQRWMPPFTLHAWDTRLRLIDKPHETVEEAWAATARPRRTKWTFRAAFVLGYARALPVVRTINKVEAQQCSATEASMAEEPRKLETTRKPSKAVARKPPTSASVPKAGPAPVTDDETSTAPAQPTAAAPADTTPPVPVEDDAEKTAPILKVVGHENRGRNAAPTWEVDKRKDAYPWWKKEFDEGRVRTANDLRDHFEAKNGRLPQNLRRWVADFKTWAANEPASATN